MYYRIIVNIIVTFCILLHFVRIQNVTTILSTNAFILRDTHTHKITFYFLADAESLLNYSTPYIITYQNMRIGNYRLRSSSQSDWLCMYSQKMTLLILGMWILIYLYYYLLYSVPAPKTTLRRSKWHSHDATAKGRDLPPYFKNAKTYP